MHLSGFATLALWASTAVAYPSRCEASKYLTVDTSSGPITGHIADNSPCVVEYLGVPYAKPPVDDLRFAPPEKFFSKKPIEAKEFGFDCPLSPSRPVAFPGLTPQAQSIISSFASSAGTPQSEDCLTLNIWSKATANSAKANKPVLVFFYGGRFAIGNTNSPFYNGKHFANAEDVVVVTVNYRTNIFGFPGAPGETANLGLRDQRASVEWIRDNIWRFGGNPSKITISGQSSGGVAVDYWTYAYQKDPIVNGIIAPSGNAFSFPVNTKAVQEKNWNTVVSTLNCADAEDVMACMRKADWEDIKAAAATIRPTASSSVLRSIPPFYPKPDNEIVFPDYVKLTKAGSFAKVPVFFGHNHNEDGYYRIPAFGNGGVVPTDAQVSSFLLESFTCPVSYQSEARERNGVPAWAYRYMADWDNTRLYPTSGAYHGVDLHMIFGGSEDVTGIAPSKAQKQLTKTMQHAWFSFSDDPQHGLSKLGWPRFNPKTKSLILLGKDTTSRVVFVKPSTFDAPCSTVTMGALGTSA